jgi:hypothetical protein
MPPYDRILVSYFMIDADACKHSTIVALGSVHHYLRWPKDGQHLVLGDCGAFSYWGQPAPPYQTPEMLEYYQALGFDLGVAIDHLIFAEHDDEKERRWGLTMHNNDEFLRLHRSGGYTFTPIGVAQGWGPDSYRRATRELMQMGYQYIAIGGLVRSQTPEILRILQAVQPELRPGTQVHLFGVNRPEQIQTFASLGVTSFDSASRLRRAWMDGRRNYFIGDAAFTAIRIPEAGGLARKHQLDEACVRRQERMLLDMLRSYAQGSAPLEETLQQALDYAALSGPLSERIRGDYRQTLEAQPWRQCQCRICQEIGVEVIIFRGNNRNRRRGFHNTWQLYQQLQASAAQPVAAAPSMAQIEMML